MMMHVAGKLSALPEGSSLQGFEILSVLGGGKASLVYKAYDHGLDRLVVIKEYLPVGIACRSSSYSVEIQPGKNELFAQGLERFIHEARHMAKFKHSVFRDVEQLISGNGTAYIVMTYHEGKTLRRMVGEGWRINNLEDLLSIILPLLSGISILHKNNFCHCDISPNNILILNNNAPILLDFGAVQRQGESTENRPITELAPGFAAKEQYETGGKLGAWTDIYAISALIYYIVTGVIPDLSYSRVSYDSLRALTNFSIPDLPCSVRKIIDIGMAVEPQNRFKDLEAFTSALKGVIEKAVEESDKPVAHKMMSVGASISSFSPRQREILQYVSELRTQFQSDANSSR